MIVLSSNSTVLNRQSHQLKYVDYQFLIEPPNLLCDLSHDWKPIPTKSRKYNSSNKMLMKDKVQRLLPTIIIENLHRLIEHRLLQPKMKIIKRYSLLIICRQKIYSTRCVDITTYGGKLLRSKFWRHMIWSLPIIRYL